MTAVHCFMMQLMRQRCWLSFDHRNHIRLRSWRRSGLGQRLRHFDRECQLLVIWLWEAINFEILLHSICHLSHMKRWIMCNLNLKMEAFMPYFKHFTVFEFVLHFFLLFFSWHSVFVILDETWQQPVHSCTFLEQQINHTMYVRACEHGRLHLD